MEFLEASSTGNWKTKQEKQIQKTLILLCVCGFGFANSKWLVEINFWF